MTSVKCPACDGYGTRPHRSKAGKVTPCKACDHTGLVPEFALPPLFPKPPSESGAPAQTQPFVWTNWPEPPNYPPTRNPDWTMPDWNRITCETIH